MFNFTEGLWSGISNTLALGANEISYQTGSAQQQNAYNLEVEKLQIEKEKQAAQARKTIFIVVGVFLLLIVFIIVKNKK